MKLKKGLGLLGLGCTAVALTGCGSSHTLTCTQEETSDNGSKTVMEAKLKYNDDDTSIESATMEMILTAPSDATDEELEQAESLLESVCEYMGEGLDCTTKRDGNTFTVRASGDVEDLGIVNDLVKETTMAEARKLLEDDGYTCK